MKWIVLDATELRKDWLQSGLTAQLLGHASWQQYFRVVVPPSVVEEIVAHHERAQTEQLEKLARLRNDLEKLGLGQLENPQALVDYRRYLMERFDEVLSFDLLNWPSVSHQELVARATRRTPPFDSKGSGYRDSLVWANVLELARDGYDVALVSADGIFRGPDGTLATPLQREVEELPGKVELVVELVPWLLQNLPWASAGLSDAVSRARDEIFFSYYLQSDIQSELAPEASDIGFDRAPYSFDVDDVDWDHEFVPLGSRKGPDGIYLSEYDVDEVVAFVAELPANARLEDGWTIVESLPREVVRVEGRVKMTLRLAVLFDEELRWSVERIAWRRRDGSLPGPSIVEPDPTSVPLFD